MVGGGGICSQRQRLLCKLLRVNGFPCSQVRGGHRLIKCAKARQWTVGGRCCSVDDFANNRAKTSTKVHLKTYYLGVEHPRRTFGKGLFVIYMTFIANASNYTGIILTIPSSCSGTRVVTFLSYGVDSHLQSPSLLNAEISSFHEVQKS